MIAGKDLKVEMRDHDHVVECVAWAPEAATQAINEAAKDAAGGDNKNRYKIRTISETIFYCILILVVPILDHSWPVAAETRASECGT